MNSKNFGIAEGRLSRDPVIRVNKDGSRKVWVNLAVRDDFVSRDGNVGCQFIDFEVFVRKDAVGNGIYDHLKKGDFVTARYTVRSNIYTRDDGASIFCKSLVIEDIHQLYDRKRAGYADSKMKEDLAG